MQILDGYRKNRPHTNSPVVSAELTEGDGPETVSPEHWAVYGIYEKILEYESGGQV